MTNKLFWRRTPQLLLWHFSSHLRLHTCCSLPYNFLFSNTCLSMLYLFQALEMDSVSFKDMEKGGSGLFQFYGWCVVVEHFLPVGRAGVSVSSDSQAF